MTRRHGYLLIAAANVVSGLSYLWQKLALDGLPPITVIAGRNLVAIALMLGWLLARRGRWEWRYPARDLARIAVLGVLAFGAPLVLGIVGVALSTASNGALLILLEPPSILLFAWLLLGNPIRRRQGLGLLFGLGGALLIVFEQGASWSGLLRGEHLTGNLLLMLHGVLWGLYTPLMRPLAQRYRATDVTLLAMVIAQLVLVPAAFTEHASWQTGPDLGRALLWTAWLGVAVSFFATVAWTASLRVLEPARIAPFVFLQPLTGVAGGLLFLDEVLTPAALAGGALVMGGVACVLADDGRAARLEAAS